MIQDLLHENWQLFETINQRAGHQAVLNPLMVVGAQDLIFVLPLLVLALWFVLARWSPLGRAAAAASVATERAQLEYDRGLGQRIALLAWLGVVFALALNLLLGHLVVEPRPFVSHPTLVHRLIAHAVDNSFPSDHAAVAGAVTTALGLYLLFVLTSAVRLRAARARREPPGAPVSDTVQVSLELRRRFVPEVVVAAGLFVVALLILLWIGFARVYTGVHYPGDIVVGALCGFVGCVVAVALRPPLEPVLAPLVRLAERARAA
jgi:membrane-associated phospholipid phosphatase